MTKTIAIVEDEDPLREVFLEALKEVGYTVVGFRDGAEAWRQLAAAPPDLIVMDMAMPEMDGHALVVRLRADATLRHIPLLIVSTLGEHLRQIIHERGARTVGVAGIMHKPVHPDALIQEVQRIIGKPPEPAPQAPGQP